MKLKPIVLLTSITFALGTLAACNPGPNDQQRADRQGSSSGATSDSTQRQPGAPKSPSSRP